MAKKKRAVETESPAIAASAGPEAPPPEKVVEYAFPTKSRCSRCGSLDTKCYATREAVQYRECRAAVCRHRYQVMGEPI